MSDDAALPRETGAEKAPETCPNCGADVPAIVSKYGGISGAACPRCYPVAAAATPPRQEAQQGGLGQFAPRETGTDTAATPVVS